jgi:hypothetical protein
MCAVSWADSVLLRHAQDLVRDGDAQHCLHGIDICGVGSGGGALAFPPAGP